MRRERFDDWRPVPFSRVLRLVGAFDTGGSGKKPAREMLVPEMRRAEWGSPHASLQQDPYLAAAIFSTWIVFVAESKVPVTLTFSPANASGFF